MEQFASYLLRIENVLIMVAVSAMISILQHVFAEQLEHNPTWARLLPATPVLLCSVVVWLPGLAQGSASQKILLGVVLGSFSGYAYKLMKQTVFGNDRRIRDHPKRL